MQITDQLTVAVVLVGILGSAGCGRPVGTAPTVPVTGQIVFKNEPLGNVSVTFTPDDGRPGMGVTDAAGRFRLTTFYPQDGAVPGRHRVTLAALDNAPASMDKKDIDAAACRPLPFPKRYAGLDTTDLEIDVPLAGLRDLRIELAP